MTNGIKPIEMAAAFNCFNDGGVYNEPYKIVKVEQTNGKQVFDKSQLGLTSRKVMSEDTASSMSVSYTHLDVYKRQTHSRGFQPSLTEPGKLRRAHRSWRKEAAA